MQLFTLSILLSFFIGMGIVNASIPGPCGSALSPEAFETLFQSMKAKIATGHARELSDFFFTKPHYKLLLHPTMLDKVPNGTVLWDKGGFWVEVGGPDWPHAKANGQDWGLRPNTDQSHLTEADRYKQWPVAGPRSDRAISRKGYYGDKEAELFSMAQLLVQQSYLPNNFLVENRLPDPPTKEELHKAIKEKLADVKFQAIVKERQRLMNERDSSFFAGTRRVLEEIESLEYRILDSFLDQNPIDAIYRARNKRTADLEKQDRPLPRDLRTDRWMDEMRMEIRGYVTDYLDENPT